MNRNYDIFMGFRRKKVSHFRAGKHTPAVLRAEKAEISRAGGISWSEGLVCVPAGVKYRITRAGADGFRVRGSACFSIAGLGHCEERQREKEAARED